MPKIMDARLVFAAGRDVACRRRRPKVSFTVPGQSGMMSFLELADEAFRDPLNKYHAFPAPAIWLPRTRGG
jgi:hypothetical protein